VPRREVEEEEEKEEEKVEAGESKRDE